MQLEYGDAYTTIKHGTVQKEVKELWVKLKGGSDNNEDLSQACVWEFKKGSTKTEIFTFEYVDKTTAIEKKYQDSASTKPQ